uniref:Large ribosomal subunit protein bL32c n=1 Tax=Chaetosphaeridium globosum TaxID=96477 RepID=RK32_CHAGL|nr:ribosomal protein L32 [Chaetosphaeridium globosum]Q8M9U3.3 RecName: Full=Large ribosomal subunit protein bL32c; AltName: Full=50S ribosomal protein L32, chloroplastic [Chaetosphaeridium globosum]AAM96561.1 ribosomal protein L32 [Chaetosphaeridium globosum]
MAVPKKRTSRSKTRIKKQIWKSQADKMALKALSLAKSVLSGKSKSFSYDVVEKSIDTN